MSPAPSESISYHYNNNQRHRHTVDTSTAGVSAAAATAATAGSSSLHYTPRRPGQITEIYNCRVLRDHAIHDNESIWIRDGKIIDPRPLFFDRTLASGADIRIDAHNAIVVPGFIDIQLNGAFGVDFSDIESVSKLSTGLTKVAKGLLVTGCTAFCPTTVSSRPELYRKALPHLGPRIGSPSLGAHSLGAHVEGPFICPEKRGAHELATLRDAKKGGMADFDFCYGLDNLRSNCAIITVAPEVPGVMDCIPRLVKECGLVVSEGHSMALTSQSEEAVRKGATCITHLFNAMNQFHHRDPGIIGLLGSTMRPRPFYGIICDGIHVHPNSVKMAYYAHPKGAILVTDAMSAMGLKPGKYTLGKMSVEKLEDRVYLRGTETLAGAVAPMNECVRNFIQFADCSLVEAIEAATLHPAKLLGIEKRKGTLRYGADADLLFINENIDILKVFLMGEECPLDPVSPVQCD
ncbi:putative N-acetylglucosamine-6-phosphate deacetylase [Ramicandelaber brevisporus]|nr:putative N-acetylglucosamine-6-phosphate deacetylase [Ramicandelaber brevisporus]